MSEQEPTGGAQSSAPPVRIQPDYERRARADVQRWRESMLRQPGILNWAASRVQSKINAYIPERIHATLTTAIKQMTEAVLTGSEFVAPTPISTGSLEERERIAKQKIEFYTRTAAAEGGVTGAGGIFLGLADFPLFLSIKLKLLFDLAAVYGHSCAEYRERLFVLRIFQLAFSSQAHRRKVFVELERSLSRAEVAPPPPDEFDWRTYQQEYRNYIDLAKLAQLVPIVGAPVGFVVNYTMTKQLGDTSMQAYRLRRFQTSDARLSVG
jgi:hypothetical protein